MWIIEIGAGTGDATAHALQALGGRSKTYTFSDVSSGFSKETRDCLDILSEKHTKRTSYVVFDLEKDPIDQGLELAPFEQIIGSLVVHSHQTREKDTFGSGETPETKQVYHARRRLPGLGHGGFVGWSWIGGDERPWEPMRGLESCDAVLKETRFSGLDICISARDFGAVFVSEAAEASAALLRELFSAGGGEGHDMAVSHNRAPGHHPVRKSARQDPPSIPVPPRRFSEGGDPVMREVLPPSRFAPERLQATTETKVNAIFLDVADTVHDPASGQILKATLVGISPTDHVFILFFAHLCAPSRMLLAGLSRSFAFSAIFESTHVCVQPYPAKQGSLGTSLAFWKRHLEPTTTTLRPLFACEKPPVRKPMTDYALSSHLAFIPG
ncbi:hypothetical protein BDW68DRAFT_182633 [Aspergillus falconensis]